jgi:hypothetical protein
MRALYEARVSDLGPDDWVKIECACGHIAKLKGAMLGTAGLPPHTKLLDLKRRLKCRSCRWRGRAEVSVNWASSA